MRPDGDIRKGVCAIMTLEDLFLTFMLYSFAGWLFETTICSLWESGHFLNRGSLLGPYCPVYGGGACFGILLGLYIQNPAKLFLFSAVLCIMVEYTAACVLENIFNMKLWDYTGMAFQFRGRVCLLGFLFFGTACTTISKFIHPAVMDWFHSIRPNLLHMISCSLAVLLAIDIVLSAMAFKRVSKRLYRFYIRWHACLNREFRSLSYAIQRRCPEWLLEDLSDMQESILVKNRNLCQKQEKQKETIIENWNRFRRF